VSANYRRSLLVDSVMLCTQTHTPADLHTAYRTVYEYSACRFNLLKRKGLFTPTDFVRVQCLVSTPKRGMSSQTSHVVE
jgi:hypothetical protein